MIPTFFKIEEGLTRTIKHTKVLSIVFDAKKMIFMWYLFILFFLTLSTLKRRNCFLKITYPFVFRSTHPNLGANFFSIYHRTE